MSRSLSPAPSSSTLCLRLITLPCDQSSPEGTRLMAAGPWSASIMKGVSSLRFRFRRVGLRAPDQEAEESRRFGDARRSLDWRREARETAEVREEMLSWEVERIRALLGWRAPAGEEGKRRALLLLRGRRGL